MASLNFCAKCERRTNCSVSPDWPPGPHKRQPLTLGDAANGGDRG